MKTLLEYRSHGVLVEVNAMALTMKRHGPSSGDPAQSKYSVLYLGNKVGEILPVAGERTPPIQNPDWFGEYVDMDFEVQETKHFKTPEKVLGALRKLLASGEMHPSPNDDDQRRR